MCSYAKRGNDVVLDGFDKCLPRLRFELVWFRPAIGIFRRVPPDRGMSRVPAKRFGHTVGYRPGWGKEVTSAQKTGTPGPPRSGGNHLPEVQFQLQFHAHSFVNLAADQLD